MTLPSEVYPADADVNALAGTSEAASGFDYLTIAEAPYYTSELKEQYRVQQLLAPAAGLRVADEGGLLFGVYPGEFFDGTTLRTYAGATGQNLTDEATNYIYLSAAGVLTVNTTGFPDPADTPHLRLATAVCASGDIESLADCRGGHAFSIPRAVSRRTAVVRWGSDYAGKASITVPIGIGLRAGALRSVKAYCGLAVTGSDGEALAIDVTVGGVSCLSGSFGFADGDAADTVKSATVDEDHDDVAADDRIEVDFTYTAGSANTLDAVLVQIEIEQLA